jgi:NAD(P)-dependent dehydrogenase (short-subunit alcohol dehydrogenase family)
VTRRALVTGGCGGIGAAIVMELARQGHEVVFTHMGQADAAAALVKTAADEGFKVVAEESDTTDAHSVDALHQRWEPLIMVHCAGIARDRMIWKQDLSDFDAVMAVNLKGAWLQVRAAAAAMRESGWGRVVLIGSINGSRGKMGQSAYASSKAALHGLAKSTARELGRAGVTVNVVEPGWVDTPMTLAVPLEFREAAVAETVTGNLCKPDDIASAVGFLCGETGRQITGQILRVDGGQYLG